MRRAIIKMLAVIYVTVLNVKRRGRFQMRRDRLTAFVMAVCLILGASMAPWNAGVVQGSENDESGFMEIPYGQSILDEHIENPDAHTYADTWSYNENGHWMDMTCAHSIDYVPQVLAHDYMYSDEFNPENSNLICSTCGYVQIPSIQLVETYSEVGQDEYGLLSLTEEENNLAGVPSMASVTQSSGISNPTQDELDAAKALVEHIKGRGSIMFYHPGSRVNVKISYDEVENSIIMTAQDITTSTTSSDIATSESKMVLKYNPDTLKRIGDVEIEGSIIGTVGSLSYTAKPQNFDETTYTNSSTYVFEKTLVQGSQSLFDTMPNETLRAMLGLFISSLEAAIISEDMSYSNIFSRINLGNLGWRKFEVPFSKIQPAAPNGDGSQNGNQESGPTINVGSQGYSVATAVNCAFGQNYSKGWTSRTDRYDCYNKIVVPSQGYITIRATKPIATNGDYSELKFEVLDNSGAKISEEKNYYANEVIDYYEYNVGLAPGTYYVNIIFQPKVITGTFTSTYNIRFTSTAYCEIEPNNGVQKATPITLNNTYKGWLNDEDFYSIDLTQGQEVFLIIENFPDIEQSTCIIYSYDPNGKRDSMSASYKNFTYDQPTGQTYHKFTPEITGKYYFEMGNYGSNPIPYGIRIATSLNGNPQNPNQNNPTHAHTYSDAWSSDATSHWHAATCNVDSTCAYARSDSSSHSFGNWITANTTNGTQERYCQVCGYRETDYNNSTNNSTFANNILNKINSASNGSWITIDAKATDVLPSNAIDALRGTTKTLEIKFTDGISWIIKGSDITGPSKDLKLSTGTLLLSKDTTTPASLKQLISSLINGADAVNISFPNNGVLPGMVTVRLLLTPDMISAIGTYGINLYYVNESTRKLDLTATNLIVNGSYIDLPISHNSNYILLKGTVAVNNNATPAVQNTAPVANVANTSSTTTAKPVSNNSGNRVSSPKTGDSFKFIMWLAMMIVAFALFAKALISCERNSRGLVVVQSKDFGFKNAKEAQDFLEEYFK